MVNLFKRELFLKKCEFELTSQQSKYDLEINKEKSMAAIETKKFQVPNKKNFFLFFFLISFQKQGLVSVIGSDTIDALAKAGPETQIKILQSLGLKSVMITDGAHPINLFNTANGLVGNGPSTGTPVGPITIPAKSTPPQPSIPQYQPSIQPSPQLQLKEQEDSVMTEVLVTLDKLAEGGYCTAEEEEALIDLTVNGNKTVMALFKAFGRDQPQKFFAKVKRLIE